MQRFISSFFVLKNKKTPAIDRSFHVILWEII